MDLLVSVCGPAGDLVHPKFVQLSCFMGYNYKKSNLKYNVGCCAVA